MGDTASLGSFIARSSEACAAVVIGSGTLLINLGACGGESAGCQTVSAPRGAKRGVPKPTPAPARSSPHVAHAQQRPARAPRSRLICIWFFYYDGLARHVHSPPSLNVCVWLFNTKWYAQ